VLNILGSVRQPPVVSPMVIAEIDYLVLDKAGVDMELEVIDDLSGGAYEIPDLDLDDLRTARRLVAGHRDLKIGMTDAVNAVLAERYDTNEILTTDQRHFRVITPLTRRFDAFRILPADL
jgi:predicted nucleic acid-binding protein